LYDQQLRCRYRESPGARRGSNTGIAFWRLIKFNLATNGNTTDAPRCMLYFSASSSYPARLKFRTIEKQGYQAHTTRDERRPVLKSPPNALT
jgi:hypothetical protein